LKNGGAESVKKTYKAQLFCFLTFKAEHGFRQKPNRMAFFEPSFDIGLVGIWAVGA